MKTILHNTFAASPKGGEPRLGQKPGWEELISIDNLLLAWQEFIKGKRNKKDVQEFQFNLMDNVLSLHHDLQNQTYKHGKYYAFKINDPKPRDIHKASVRDRLLHHAVYRILYPFFDKTFIADSFSCRNGKGTHKAINQFRAFAYQVSNNNTKTCWILKCDIKKFFASISHEKLMEILSEYIEDKEILSVLRETIQSFDTRKSKNPYTANSAAAEFAVYGKTGLPLGNLTSQLFANIYMNKFDQFMKHGLRVKYYIRYADDFVILSDNKSYLESLETKIKEFLQSELKLTLHPDKIYIKTLNSGLDFLGWVHFFDHRVLRRTTRRRVFKKLKENYKLEVLSSYLGLISHGNGYKIRNKLLESLIL